MLIIIRALKLILILMPPLVLPLVILVEYAAEPYAK